MKRFLIFLTIAMGAIIAQACACKVIDNSEVGIKFKKFGLTDQGKLEAESVSGYIFQKVRSRPVFLPWYSS